MAGRRFLPASTRLAPGVSPRKRRRAKCLRKAPGQCGVLNSPSFLRSCQVAALASCQEKDPWHAKASPANPQLPHAFARAAQSRPKRWALSVSAAPSARCTQAPCITGRSRRAPTAAHVRPGWAKMFIVPAGPYTLRCRARLTSNVRRHETTVSSTSTDIALWLRH